MRLTRFDNPFQCRKIGYEMGQYLGFVGNKIHHIQKGKKYFINVFYSEYIKLLLNVGMLLVLLRMGSVNKMGMTDMTGTGHRDHKER